VTDQTPYAAATVPLGRTCKATASYAVYATPICFPNTAGIDRVPIQNIQLARETDRSYISASSYTPCRGIHRLGCQDRPSTVSSFANRKSLQRLTAFQSLASGGQTSSDGALPPSKVSTGFRCLHSINLMGFQRLMQLVPVLAQHLRYSKRRFEVHRGCCDDPDRLVTLDRLFVILHTAFG
jgi:hypothetical protein